MRSSLTTLLFFWIHIVSGQESVQIIGGGGTSHEMVCAFNKGKDGSLYQLVQSYGYSVYVDTIYVANPNGLSNTSFTYLVKYDSLLNIEWIRTYAFYTTNGPAPYSFDRIAFDNDNNIYITAYHMGDATVGQFSIVGSGTSMLTFKLNSQGNPVWLVPIGANAIQYKNSYLELFEVGSLNDSIASEPIVNGLGCVLRLDTAGNYISHFQLNSQLGYERVLGQMNSGDYYGIRKNYNIANAPVPLEMFKTDSMGAITYYKMINYCRNSNGINDIVYDPATDEIIVAAMFGDQEPFDSIQFNIPKNRYGIVKLDNMFNVKHVINLSASYNIIGASLGDFVMESRNGELFFGGTVNTSISNSQISFWSHLGPFNPVGGFRTQIVYGKLDKSLNCKWFRKWPQNYYMNLVNHIIADKYSNQVYITGSTNQFNFENLNFTINGYDDAYLLKLNDLDTTNITFQGTVFVDEDMNGVRDSNEIGYPNLAVFIDSSSSVTYTDINGDYRMSGIFGVNIIRPKLPLYWTFSTQDSTVTNITSANTIITGINFGVYAVPGVFDLSIDLENPQPFRPGFNSNLFITYKNEGTDTANGVITLYKDTVLIYNNSSVIPLSFGADSIVWSFTNLAPGETRTISMSGHVLNNTVLIGHKLYFSTRIDSVQTDTFPQNNYDLLYATIVGSFDPNNKTTRPACGVNQYYFSEGSFIDYTINFQNTGTFTAENVFITDTLSQNLDAQSFTFVNCSHPVQIERDSNIIRFYFLNIMLPDSMNNPSQSSGFIKFKVKPTNSIQPGNPVKNKAYIYFDFNPPIVTNEVITDYADPSQLATVLADSIECDIVILPQCNQNSVRYSIDGANFSYNNYYSHLAPGHYNAWMIMQDDTINLGEITGGVCYFPSAVDNFLSEVQFKVYPNPASEFINIKYQKTDFISVDAELLNIYGKIISLKLLYKGDGLFSADLNKMPTGVYILRISVDNTSTSFKIIKL